MRYTSRGSLRSKVPMERLYSHGLRSFGFVALTLVTATGGCGNDSRPPDAQVSGQSAALTASPWQVGHAYAVGDLVSMNGRIYRCVQAHTSQVGWDPESIPALWAFEALEQTDDAGLPTTPPKGGLNFDYLTLQADCDANPESCCEVGSV
jgi:hypothetical protein